MSFDLKDNLVSERLGDVLPSRDAMLPKLDHVPMGATNGRDFPRTDFQKIKRQLGDNAALIARQYFPSGRQNGKHWCTGDIYDAPPGSDGGSFKLDLDGEHAGCWHDFATGENGDLLDLIRRRERLDVAAAISHCERQGWLNAQVKVTPVKTTSSKDSERKRAEARRLWEQSQAIEETVGEVYLRSRGLPPPYSRFLRFHPNAVCGHPALIVAFMAPSSTEINAVQVTALKADGSGKAEIKAPRRTFGSPEGAGVVVQDNPTATEVIIAEGVETAMSLRAAAPDAQIVAYGPKNNLANAQIDHRFTQVTIAADQDALTDAEEFAAKLHNLGKQVRIACPAPPEAKVAKGYDFNDLLCESGLQAVTERLSRAEYKAPLPIARRGIGQPIFWDDPDEPEPDPLIERLLDKGSCTLIFGQPNVGKTFVTYAISRYVAAGQALCGRAVEQGAVLYLQFEGHQGIQRRKAALKIGYSDRNLPLVFVKANVNFIDGEEAFDWLANLIALVEGQLNQRISLVVIDTLSAACAGYEENDNGRGALIIQNFKKATTDQGMTLIVVHHSGKDASKGPRGGTVLRGNFDNVIEVKDGEIVSDKMRESEKADLLKFELVKVTVGKTRRGLDITSCYAEFSLPSGIAHPRKSGPKTGELQMQICELLNNAPFGLTREQLMEGLPSGQSRDSLRKTLKKLAKVGTIRSEGALYLLKD
jgi:phage/plasmid primase-like uncharacterized protein